MRDPYEVLGVPRGASTEQVKAAYKELAAKYQQNGYENGPLADIAQKKMDELNEAYDAIIMSSPGSGSGGRTGSQSSGSYGSYNSGASYYAQNDYADIRSKIAAGRLDDAEMLLDGTAPSSRTAEWYYLKGSVQQRRGWLEEASKNFDIAANMEPSNATYRAAADNARSARNGGYKTERRKSGGSDCGFCDICSGLMCADCCCECFGGDLIPCC